MTKLDNFLPDGVETEENYESTPYIKIEMKETGFIKFTVKGELNLTSVQLVENIFDRLMFKYKEKIKPIKGKINEKENN